MRSRTRDNVPATLAVSSNTRRAPSLLIYGIITKEHAADSVTKTVQIYPG
jgi:hypothetical protein